MRTSDYFLLRRIGSSGTDWVCLGLADARRATGLERDGLVESRPRPEGGAQRHFRLSEKGEESVRIERERRSSR